MDVGFSNIWLVWKCLFEPEGNKFKLIGKPFIVSSYQCVYAWLVEWSNMVFKSNCVLKFYSAGQCCLSKMKGWAIRSERGCEIQFRWFYLSFPLKHSFVELKILLILVAFKRNWYGRGFVCRICTMYKTIAFNLILATKIPITKKLLLWIVFYFCCLIYSFLKVKYPIIHYGNDIKKIGTLSIKLQSTQCCLLKI